MRVSSVDPVSLGKVYGVLGALGGLLIGILYALIGFAMAGVASQSTPGTSAPPGATAGMVAAFTAFGVFAIVLFPIFYGVGGFICGLLGGLFYNLAAKMTGGIEFTVE